MTNDRITYANVAVAGDRIRAYDFQPCPGRDDRYVEGEVLEVTPYNFIVAVDKDTLYGDGERTMVRVPFETLMTDYEGRVTKL